MFLTCLSLQILEKTQNSDRGISNFQISGQSFINENGYSSRASHNIHMKHGPVTKLDKRNTVTSKKFGDNVMSTNGDVIVKSGRLIIKLTFSLL